MVELSSRWTAYWNECWSVASDELVLLMLNDSMGGFTDTLAIEMAVKPTGAPSTADVTTHTLLAVVRKAERKADGSMGDVSGVDETRVRVGGGLG